MKSIFSFACVMLLILISCSDTTDTTDPTDPVDLYPSLKVVNQYESRLIKSVSLVGYEFNNLLITAGNSQTFALDGGMPGGYSNININVSYGSGSVTRQINSQFNFEDGETTTITLKGSSGEGSPYYNNTQLE